MSGGSWDYLYGKDVANTGVLEQIEQMAASLDERGFSYAGDAWGAWATRADDGLEPLSIVAHAVEWVDSNDWNPDQLEEAVKRVILCKCSPGDDCVCPYDCNCRDRFAHHFEEDQGWRNEGLKNV